MEKFYVHQRKSAIRKWRKMLSVILSLAMVLGTMDGSALVARAANDYRFSVSYTGMTGNPVECATYDDVVTWINDQDDAVNVNSTRDFMITYLNQESNGAGNEFASAKNYATINKLPENAQSITFTADKDCAGEPVFVLDTISTGIPLVFERAVEIKDCSSLGSVSVSGYLIKLTRSYSLNSLNVAGHASVYYGVAENKSARIENLSIGENYFRKDGDGSLYVKGITFTGSGDDKIKFGYTENINDTTTRASVLTTETDLTKVPYEFNNNRCNTELELLENGGDPKTWTLNVRKDTTKYFRVSYGNGPTLEEFTTWQEALDWMNTKNSSENAYVVESLNHKNDGYTVRLDYIPEKAASLTLKGVADNSDPVFYSLTLPYGAEKVEYPLIIENTTSLDEDVVYENLTIAGTNTQITVDDSLTVKDLTVRDTAFFALQTRGKITVTGSLTGQVGFALQNNQGEGKILLTMANGGSLTEEMFYKNLRNDYEKEFTVEIQENKDGANTKSLVVAKNSGSGGSGSQGEAFADPYNLAWDGWEASCEIPATVGDAQIEFNLYYKNGSNNEYLGYFSRAIQKNRTTNIIKSDRAFEEIMESGDYYFTAKIVPMDGDTEHTDSKEVTSGTKTYTRPSKEMGKTVATWDQSQPGRVTFPAVENATVYEVRLYSGDPANNYEVSDYKSVDQRRYVFERDIVDGVGTADFSGGIRFTGGYRVGICVYSDDIDNIAHSMGDYSDVLLVDNLDIFRKHTVTFNLQGHGTAISAQTVREGGLVVAPAAPKAEGYTFGGWYKDSDCTTRWAFATDTVRADTTLYAKWTEGEDLGTSGTLGANGRIEWTYDEGTKTLTVTGGGAGGDELAGVDDYTNQRFESAFKAIFDALDVEKVVFDNCKLTGRANGLFQYEGTIKEVDCSGLDVSGSNDISYMFAGCYSLTKVTFGGKFDTSGIRYMQYMFYRCRSLTELDLSGFSTAKLENAYHMFENCNSLVTIKTPAVWPSTWQYDSNNAELPNIFEDGSGTKYNDLPLEGTTLTRITSVMKPEVRWDGGKVRLSLNSEAIAKLSSLNSGSVWLDFQLYEEGKSSNTNTHSTGTSTSLTEIENFAVDYNDIPEFDEDGKFVVKAKVKVTDNDWLWSDFACKDYKKPSAQLAAPTVTVDENEHKKVTIGRVEHGGKYVIELCSVENGVVTKVDDWFRYPEDIDAYGSGMFITWNKDQTAFTMNYNDDYTEGTEYFWRARVYSDNVDQYFRSEYDRSDSFIGGQTGMSGGGEAKFGLSYGSVSGKEFESWDATVAWIDSLASDNTDYTVTFYSKTGSERAELTTLPAKAKSVTFDVTGASNRREAGFDLRGGSTKVPLIFKTGVGIYGESKPENVTACNYIHIEGSRAMESLTLLEEGEVQFHAESGVRMTVEKLTSDSEHNDIMKTGAGSVTLHKVEGRNLSFNYGGESITDEDTKYELFRFGFNPDTLDYHFFKNEDIEAQGVVVDNGDGTWSLVVQKPREETAHFVLTYGNRTEKLADWAAVLAKINALDSSTNDYVVRFVYQGTETITVNMEGFPAKARSLKFANNDSTMINYVIKGPQTGIEVTYPVTSCNVLYIEAPMTFGTLTLERYGNLQTYCPIRVKNLIMTEEGDRRFICYQTDGVSKKGSLTVTESMTGKMEIDYPPAFDDGDTLMTVPASVTEDQVTETNVVEGYRTKWQTNNNGTKSLVLEKTHYRVFFDKQGHGGANFSLLAAKDGNGTVTKPDDPVETGYTFGGWFKEADCTTAWDFSTVVTEDTILYAKWTKNSDVSGGDPEIPVEKTYTVTFNLQGHGAAIESVKVKSGEKLTAPNPPEAAGFVFGGWFKDKACTTAWDFANDTVTVDITLYAKWTEDKSTVTPEDVEDSLFKKEERKNLKDDVGAEIGKINDKVYDGNAYLPTVKVTANVNGRKETLIEGIDYRVAYWHNVNAGTGKVIVRGNGIYDGEIEKEFTIKQKPMNKLKVVAGGIGRNSTAELPVYVYDGSRLLTLGEDYKLEVPGGLTTSAGKQEVTVVPGENGNYTGSCKAKVTVYDAEKVLNDSDVTLEGIPAGGYTYSSKAFKPTVKVTFGNDEVAKKNYTVKYTNNKEAGIACVTVTGKKEFAGCVVKTFEIKPQSGGFETKEVKAVTYNGKYQKPKVTVKAGGKTLKAGKDYLLFYSNNLHATKEGGSKAKITIKGLGNYVGTPDGTAYFEIKPQKINKVSVKGTKEKLEVTYLKRPLQKDIDYTVEPGEEAKGKVPLTITGKGDFAGSVVKKVKVQ